ncbi:MAG: hypothetical protein BGO67_11865 [Alphaproteobacteria bacterium 41-28]|nr:MAG: hypothetical protein BGO67_11865 [Alphaproteobacteria bacterium 41-28]
MNIRQFLFYSLIFGNSIVSCSLPSRAMEAEEVSLDQSHLMNLPRELHVLAALYFSPRELANLALVSSYWKTISETDSLWWSIGKRLAEENDFEFLEDSILGTNVKTRLKKDIDNLTVFQITNATLSALDSMIGINVFHTSSVESMQSFLKCGRSFFFISPDIRKSLSCFKRKIESGESCTIREDHIRKHINQGSNLKERSIVFSVNLTIVKFEQYHELIYFQKSLAKAVEFPKEKKGPHTVVRYRITQPSGRPCVLELEKEFCDS